MSEPSATLESRLRRALRLAAAAVFVVTPLELILTEHTGSAIQYLPFAACAVGLVALWAVGQVGSLRRTGQALLALVAGVSALGCWEHIEHNYAFVSEIRPNAETGEVVFEALFGASPLLAPGILALAAALAWASGLRH